MYKVKFSVYKNNKPTKLKLEVITSLFIFIMGFFLITTAYDIGVTLTVYVTNTEYFFENEANKLFAWGMDKQLPILWNPSILAQIAIAALYFVSYVKIKEKSSKKIGVWTTIFIGMSIILIVASSAHLSGGNSWLYSGGANG